MQNIKCNAGRITVGCLLLIIGFFLIINALIGSWLWPYTINTWLVFLNKPPTVTHLQGALFAFVPVIGQCTIPAAIITWFLMLFL